MYKGGPWPMDATVAKADTLKNLETSRMRGRLRKTR